MKWELTVVCTSDTEVDYFSLQHLCIWYILFHLLRKKTTYYNSTKASKGKCKETEVFTFYMNSSFHLNVFLRLSGKVNFIT